MFEELLAELKETYYRCVDNEEFPLKLLLIVIEVRLKAYVREMSLREASVVETVKEEKDGSIKQVFYFLPLNYSKLIEEFSKNHEKCQEWKCEKIDLAQMFERIY